MTAFCCHYFFYYGATMNLFHEFYARAGIFGVILVLYVLYRLIAPLVEQWTDGEEWNGEWPFFHKKKKKDE